MNEFEKEFVLKSYNQIAEHFSITRTYPWPSVEKFIKSLQSGSLALDAGCGNGKNMLIRDDIKMVGCDLCPEFIDICKSRDLDVIEADIRNLPYESNSFDATISIAVIHHISTHEDRKRAYEEIIRVTKPGGLVYFQVWAEDAVNGDKFIPIENGEDGDYYVTWSNQKDRTIVKRFYHMFKEEEVDLLISQLDGIRLVEKYNEKHNWIVLLEKI